MTAALSCRCQSDVVVRGGEHSLSPALFHHRTGILTKPDLVDKGTERVVLSVAQNLTYHLKKGYMIVKCRGQQEISDKLSLAEATRREMSYFETHPYFR